jgi:hypothetical protein
MESNTTWKSRRMLKWCGHNVRWGRSRRSEKRGKEGDEIFAQENRTRKKEDKTNKMWRWVSCGSDLLGCGAAEAGVTSFQTKQWHSYSVLSPPLSSLSFPAHTSFSCWPPLGFSGQSSWLLTQRSRVPFSALPDVLSSSGSGMGSTQPMWG